MLIKVIEGSDLIGAYFPGDALGGRAPLAEGNSVRRTNLDRQYRQLNQRSSQVNNPGRLDCSGRLGLTTPSEPRGKAITT